MTDDTAELDAQIADAEAKGDPGLAAQKKAELLGVISRRPPLTPDEKRIAELRQQADDALTLGNFAEASRLRAEWIRALR